MFPGVRLLIKVDNKMGLINTKTFVYVKGSEKKDVEGRNIPYLPLSYLVRDAPSAPRVCLLLRASVALNPRI